jgi:gluconate 2-dehydrogenase subunit 3-like protein
MSEITRRDLLGRLAAAFVAGASIDHLLAQEAHHAVQQAAAAGSYVPKALTAAEFKTLERLTDLIIPIDNGKPGAVAAGVAEWIDTLAGVNDELKARYTKGLAWLDTAMTSRGAADFARATTQQQTALLDLIAYQKNRSAELDPGIDFFILARRMTVDGFYTSRIGMPDIYPGNRPQAKFVVPQEAVDYVLKKSGLG